MYIYEVIFLHTCQDSEFQGSILQSTKSRALISNQKASTKGQAKQPSNLTHDNQARQHPSHYIIARTSCM